MRKTNGNANTNASLWKATLAAVLVAATLLITVILPAEYGIDPTSAGRLLGVTALAPGDVVATGAAENAISVPEPVESAEELVDDFGDNIRPADPGSFKIHGDTFKNEEAIIELAAFEEVEVKARMNEGDSLFYSWQVAQPVYVDIHGEPLAYPAEAVVRYEERDDVTSGQGRVTATFPGLHGWYWLNTNESPVSVRLKVTGYYSTLEEVSRNQR